jgi:hypothetical protein
VKIANAAISSGLKARHVTAWAGASPTSAGPGNLSQIISQGLKGRNQFTAIVPPFQGGEVYLGMFTRGFAGRSTPGCHITGFQPARNFRATADRAEGGRVDGAGALRTQLTAPRSSLLTFFGIPA